MWVTILFALINFVMARVGRLVKLPGFDLMPIAIIIIARSGESILLGTIILTLAHGFRSFKKLRYLWLTFPALLAIGYLSLIVTSPFLLIVLYHLISALTALFLGFFGFRYFLFVMVNMGLNISVARLSTWIG